MKTPTRLIPVSFKKWGRAKRTRTRILLLSTLTCLFLAAGACSTTQPPGEDPNGSGSTNGEAPGCVSGQTACGDFCVDLFTNSTSCGSCGNACTSGSSCLGGACQCQANLTACTSGCADITSDGANCGACGTACGVGTVCDAGACAAGCSEGRSQCGSSCVDFLSNVSHCGACDSPCMNGMACVAGACECPAGQTCDGGTPIGTGGMSAVGGGSGTGGDGSGGEPSGPNGGYITSGAWAGYMWTATFGTATISPEDFGEITDFPACASGTVSTGTSNGAMVGWNINQMVEDDPDGTVITPTLDGITVSVTSKTSANLRVQIQTPTGSEDEDSRWCADIGTGGQDIFLPFSSFNTHCWDPDEGTYYAPGTPISQVIIQVPGVASGAVNFDFCVDKFVETDSDGNPAGQGCDLNAGTPGSSLTGTMTMSNQYDRKPVNTGAKQYYVQNNAFNPPGGLTYQLSYDGAFFNIDSQSGTQSTSGAPIAYPSIFIGSNNGGDGQATAGSNLPKSVGSLTAVPTAWSWSPPSSGQYNAAYDVWFSTNGSGESGVGSRTFLMVWFDRTSGIYAEGEGEGHGAGIYTIDGKNFNVYVSTQFEGRPIISYVAQSQITSWSFDLNDFIQDAKGRNSTGGSGADVIKDDYVLTNIFAGFEIWNGSANIKTNGFCAEVN